MNENESNSIVLIVICLTIIVAIICFAGDTINEKQQQINELINKQHQQIELIDALQQSK